MPSGKGKGGKKGDKQTQSLAAFLAPETGSSNWADDEPEDFLVGGGGATAGNANAASTDWRGGGGGGQEAQRDRPFARGGMGGGGRDGDRRNDQPKTFPTQPPWSLYIGNLSYDSSQDEIGAFFAEQKAGVKEVRLIMDRDTNRPKGFGYVEFETLEDLKAGLNLSGASLGGRKIKLDLTTDNNRGGRDGGRSGGFGGGGGGFSDFGGRDDMGKQNQPSMEGRDRNRGGGGAWEGGRDGFGAQQPQLSGGGGGASFDRGAMGQQAQQPPERRQMGFDRDAMGQQSQQPPQQRKGFGRDEMGSNTIPAKDAPGFGRDAMGSSQPPQRQERERPMFSRDALGSQSQAASEPPPPSTRTQPPAPWDREAMGAEQPPSRPPQEQHETGDDSPPARGQGRSFDRNGFGSSSAAPSGGADSWRSNNEANKRSSAGGARGGSGGAGGGGGASWRNEDAHANDTDEPKKVVQPRKDQDGFTEVKKEEKEEQKKQQKPKQPKPQQKEDKKKEPVAANPWEVLGKKSKKKK